MADYYHQTLKASPEALAYLEKRGLKFVEAIDTFKLGFANRTLGLRLPLKNRAAGEELRGKLQRLGVLRESGHEHLNGSRRVAIRSTSSRARTSRTRMEIGHAATQKGLVPMDRCAVATSRSQLTWTGKVAIGTS